MRKNILLHFLCWASLPLVFAGCIAIDFGEAKRNLDNSKKLRVGMNKAQVLKVMGSPLRDELYNRPNTWYYYVRCRWRDGMRTQDECMPLVFKSGKLIGWGEEYLLEKQVEHAYVR